MKKKLQIPVIFRVIDGWVEGFLPTRPHTYDRIMCVCLEEGHAEADYFYAISGRLARPDEYDSLLRYLRSIYDDDTEELVIRKRIATYWKPDDVTIGNLMP